MTELLYDEQKEAPHARQRKRIVTMTYAAVLLLISMGLIAGSLSSGSATSLGIVIFGLILFSCSLYLFLKAASVSFIRITNTGFIVPQRPISQFLRRAQRCVPFSEMKIVIERTPTPLLGDNSMLLIVTDPGTMEKVVSDNFIYKIKVRSHRYASNVIPIDNPFRPPLPTAYCKVFAKNNWRLQHLHRIMKNACAAHGVSYKSFPLPISDGKKWCLSCFSEVTDDHVRCPVCKIEFALHEKLYPTSAELKTG